MYQILSHSYSLWSLQWRSVIIIFYILLGAKARSGQLSHLLKVPLLVNSKTDLSLLLTPKPQACLPESNVPALSLQILPGTCNQSEIQEKRAFDFACTRVTCCFRLAKKCFCTWYYCAYAAGWNNSSLDSIRLISYTCMGALIRLSKNSLLLSAFLGHFSVLCFPFPSVMGSRSELHLCAPSSHSSLLP